MNLRIGFESAENAEKAFQWHHGFSGSVDSLIQKSIDEIRTLAKNNQLISVTNQNDNTFIAQIYYVLDGDEAILGGLMLDTKYRKLGLGLFFVSLTVALIYSECNVKNIKANIVKNNESPDKILNTLNIKKNGNSKSILVGITQENIKQVEVLEYISKHPETLSAIISVLENHSNKMSSKLFNGLFIDFDYYNNIETWCADLRDLINQN